MDRRGLRARFEQQRGATSLPGACQSLAERVKRKMWSELAAKDLTDSDVLKTEALRMKWKANPTTSVAER